MLRNERERRVEQKAEKEHRHYECKAVLVNICVNLANMI